MALIVGPSNSGKTLLVKRLIEGKNALPLTYENLPSTLPTTGMGLQNVVLNNKKSVSIREIGGEMAPIWPIYYKDSDSIIVRQINVKFVIDSSNSFQFSCALIQIIELLKYVVDQPKKRVLLVLNKSDMDTSNGHNFDFFQDLLDSVNQSDSNQTQLSIIRTSCTDCTNLNMMKDWLLKCV